MGHLDEGASLVSSGEQTKHGKEEELGLCEGRDC